MELIQAPQKVTPTFNFVTFVVSSDNINLYNHKYLCDIRIYNDNSNSYEFAARVAVYADVTTGYGIFRIDQILKSYVKETLHTYKDNEDFLALPLAKASTNSIIKYSVEFGEEYSTTPTSVITQYMGLLSVTDGYTWNGLLSHDEFLNYEGYEYSVGTKERKFLNVDNRATIPVGYNDDFYLSFIANELNNTDVYLNVKTYGLFNPTYKFQTYIPVTTDSQTHLQSLNVGPMGINTGNPDSNSLYPATMEWLKTAIDPTVTKYDVWLSWKNLADSNLLGSTTPFVDESGYNNDMGYDPGAGGWIMGNNLQADYNLSTSGNTSNFPNCIISEPLAFGETYDISVNFLGDISAINTAYCWVQIGENDLGSNKSAANSTVGVQSHSGLVAAGDCKVRLFFSVDIPSPLGVGILVAGTTVTIQSVTDLKISETITFEINNCPSKFERYRLRWLNKLGGHQLFNFDFKSKQDITFDRKEYTQNLTRWQPNGGYGYNMTDKERTGYAVNTKTITTINTNWLNKDEIDLMEDLLSSTSHYLQGKHEVLTFDFVENDITNTEYLIFSITSEINNFKVGDYVQLIFDSMTAAGPIVPKLYTYNSNSYKIININLADKEITVDAKATIPFGIFQADGKLYKVKNDIKPIIITKNSLPKEPFKNTLFGLTLTFEDSNVQNSRR